MELQTTSQILAERDCVWAGEKYVFISAFYDDDLDEICYLIENLSTGKTELVESMFVEFVQDPK
jgi:hypothetical protein